MLRVIAAAGGEMNVRRHATMEAVYEDVLGQITLKLRSVRFDVPRAGDAFRLKLPAPAAVKRAS